MNSRELKVGLADAGTSPLRISKMEFSKRTIRNAELYSSATKIIISYEISALVIDTDANVKMFPLELQKQTIKDRARTKIAHVSVPDKAFDNSSALYLFVSKVNYKDGTNWKISREEIDRAVKGVNSNGRVI